MMTTDIIFNSISRETHIRAKTHIFAFIRSRANRLMQRLRPTLVIFVVAGKMRLNAKWGSRTETKLLLAGPRLDPT